LLLTKKLSFCLLKQCFGQGSCYFGCDKIVYLQQGPALASAGPDLKHLCGAPLSGV